MEEAHVPSDEHESLLKTYLVIFCVLCVFTLISFIVNFIFGIGSLVGMAIILFVAVCKATLVGMYFMHLKFEWSKLYFLIVPVAILAVMMMIVLMPDSVAGWPNEPLPEDSPAGLHP